MGYPNRTKVLNQLDSDCGSLAAADAERGIAAFQTTRAEGVDQWDDESRAGHPDGMSQGTGAAIHIDRGVVKSHIMHGVHCDAGKLPR